MAPNIDSTLGGATSNSYISLAEATAIAQNEPFADKWTATSDDDLLVALITATRWMETIDYDGTRCNETQRLKWPRDGATCDGVTSSCSAIPYAIQETEVILAWVYVQKPESFPDAGGGGGATDSTLYVSKNQLGDLVQEFSERSNSTGPGNDCASCNDPVIINQFPWLKDLLKCWMSSASSSGTRVIARVRS